MKSFSFLNHCLHSFIDLLFPPLCFHCGHLIEKHSTNLCSSCSTLLQFIEPKGRCLYCFNDMENEKLNICPRCLRKPSIFHRIGAAFDYSGPAASLVKKIKYGNQPYLAKGAGAFLAAQFLQLNWPIPDLIVPVPLSSAHLFQRGYNQSELMAQSMAAILGRPLKNVLGRKNGGYSQAALPFQKRALLDKELFFLKKDADLHDRVILLVDDVMTTGATFFSCGSALLEQSPDKIYGIALCRTGADDD